MKSVFNTSSNQNIFAKCLAKNVTTGYSRYFVQGIDGYYNLVIFIFKTELNGALHQGYSTWGKRRHVRGM